MSVLLETSLGDIVIDLYTDERPKCCRNFLKLCKVKYYNFCLFHSVQRNLVAQTGDPTGTGKGGESLNGLLYGEQAKYFDMEVAPRIKHKNAGLVSMVNNGGNMHGSQFFFTLGESLDYLDNVHTVFGEVAEGMDVLMKINEAYCDTEHRPYKDIRIYHTILLDDPYDDPAGLEVPDRSPEPTKEQLDSGRIGADEEIDDFKGMSEEQVQELLEEREAKANAQILAMVGDIPEEDIAPPENVLFVCKLNPVTTDEDLEIIFSRFGTIKSCEVIRDQKTKESLQYAFIEFDNPQSCENAYFKMDNVLIDDRRIHVDFSQSVSKYKWKGKGRGVEVQDEEKDSFSSKYRIKDQSRRDNRYELVFEEEEVDVQKKKKKKKNKHDSDSEQEKTARKKHSKQSRSESPAATGKYYNERGNDTKDKYRDQERVRAQKNDRNEERGRKDKYHDSNEERDRGNKYNYRNDDRGSKYDRRDDRGSKYLDRSEDRDRGNKYPDKSEARGSKYDRSEERGSKYQERSEERGSKYQDRSEERGSKYRDRSEERGSKYRDRSVERKSKYDRSSERVDKYGKSERKTYKEDGKKERRRSNDSSDETYRKREKKVRSKDKYGSKYSDSDEDIQHRKR